MAQHETKLIAEGEHSLYINDATVWVARFGNASGIKVGLSYTRRGKAVTQLILFNTAGKLWAVELAEYCIKAGLPWPSFRTYKDMISVLKALKRKRVPLRVKVTLRTHDGTMVYPSPTLLRPEET